MEEKEMLDIVAQDEKDLQKACDTLVDLANNRGGWDNSTAILLRYEGSQAGM
jgi:serine/threonine protein phosphatase PrpC